jgi:hypothetical protein
MQKSSHPKAPIHIFHAYNDAMQNHVIPLIYSTLKHYYLAIPFVAFSFSQLFFNPLPIFTPIMLEDLAENFMNGNEALLQVDFVVDVDAG